VMRRPLFAATTVLAVALAGAGAASAKPPAQGGGLIVEVPHTIVVHKGDTQLTIPFSMTNVTPQGSTGQCVFGIGELFGGIGELGPGETTSHTVVIDVPSDRISTLTLSIACFLDLSNNQTVKVVRAGPLGV
jgi:hypothetical protein